MNNPLTDSVIACQGLGKTFDDGRLHMQVFDGIDFSLARGERVAVVGASGAGKSTFLHLLGGLDTPTAGEVWVSGQMMSSLSDAARGKLRNEALGFVYQFHHLLPEFSALENVAMPLLIRRMPREQAFETAAALLKRVGLGSRLEHKPGELSGGERQRAAVARALVTRPACVLADEPTGNLDTRTAATVFDLMLEMNRELGTSLVVVTHDMRLAARMDRIWQLEGGRLREYVDGQLPVGQGAGSAASLPSTPRTVPVSASRWLRLANFFIDYLAIVAILTAIDGFSSWAFGRPSKDLIGFGGRLCVAIMTTLVYYSLLEGFTGRTVGKWITRTLVVNERGGRPTFKQAIGRALCRYIPFEGLSVFIEDRRAWHDGIPGTFVVKRSRKDKGVAI